jgi:hypothetical protein
MELPYRNLPIDVPLEPPSHTNRCQDHICVLYFGAQFELKGALI